jgi:hypothetical protein
MKLVCFYLSSILKKHPRVLFVYASFHLSVSRYGIGAVGGVGTVGAGL